MALRLDIVTWMCILLHLDYMKSFGHFYPWFKEIASTKTKQGKFLFTVITINIFITSTGIVVRASGLPDLVTSAHQLSEWRKNKSSSNYHTRDGDKVSYKLIICHNIYESSHNQWSGGTHGNGRHFQWWLLMDEEDDIQSMNLYCVVKLYFMETQQHIIQIIFK